MSTPATSPSISSTALADLRADVRQRTDLENDPHVSDRELTRWVNAHYAELYDQLVTMFGEDYFQTTALITTDGVNQQFPLPADFYKALLVEVQNSFGVQMPGSTVPAWITINPFNLREKNKGNLINFASYFGWLNMRYRIVGNTIMFAPPPTGGQTLRIWYAPRLTPVSDVGIIALQGVVAGDQVTINGTTFVAVAGAPSGNQFQVGASDAATAANLASAITGAQIAGVQYVATGPIGQDVPLPFPADGSGALAANPLLPASSVLISIYNASITWSTSGSHISLSPGPQGARADPTVSPTTYTWGDVLDGVSGWIEGVALGAAIKALQKQERDTSGLAAEKVAFEDRLQRAAPNRNIGDPNQVTETMGDYPFPGAPGMGWPGGNWF